MLAGSGGRADGQQLITTFDSPTRRGLMDKNFLAFNFETLPPARRWSSRRESLDIHARQMRAQEGGVGCDLGASKSRIDQVTTRARRGRSLVKTRKRKYQKKLPPPLHASQVGESSIEFLRDDVYPVLR